MSGDWLSFNDLRASLASRAVLRGAGARFSVPGLVALVGPNGAGKTTLMRALAGLLPVAGRIAIQSRDAGSLDAPARARLVSYLPQTHAIHWPLPARDIVALGRYALGARSPQHLSMADAAAVRMAMEATETTAFADRPATELSGGERARVALARVLAAGTPIILADEPILSLDPRHQLAILSLLRETARAGRLVLAVLHDLPLAWRFADRVLVMQEGRIVADGAPAAALNDDILAGVFGVRATMLTEGGGTTLAMLRPV